MAVFLERNGLPLNAPEHEATNTMLRLAADGAFAPQFRE
jgi:prophage maintenance system killer protein